MGWSKLVKIVEKLRSPGGCPWDREQTHKSLKRYLLEESYELLEAIDNEDTEGIKDELGDVLLQVLLHAQIKAEQNEFTVDDVITNLSAKLIRRHPHVFAHVHADTPEEVVVTWDSVKKQEKTNSARTSVLDGVPSVFPALMKAEKIQKKASKVGFDWDETHEVLEKVYEELSELEEAIHLDDQDKLRDELGDLLFATVNLARFIKVDPELALQQGTAKFVTRFKLLESYAKEQNLDLTHMRLSELNRLWDQAKAQLRKNPHS
ncbi:MAG: nucleoside triphosphate pyrophosphohydrolase [Bacillota bacterium]|nr:nucleoside triphosphate pyrophosphohydrolase [Bacillota bacterium]HHU62231.1 nucleoside triphosphate pyrophosphohydrolase [Natronincola sp.]